MARTRPTTERDAGRAAGRELTFTEKARREQIIGCAIELVAELGSTQTSLAKIAGRAKISKAAVLYHFESKDQIMELALESVVTSVTEQVGADVGAAVGPWAQLEAYVRSLIRYVRANPSHVRILADAMATDEISGQREPGAGQRRGRWEPVAGILSAGQESGEFGSFDPRTYALWIGGGIDALFGEWADDRSFDLDEAVDAFVDVIKRVVS